MLDLEFPMSRRERPALICGIYLLQDDGERRRALFALRAQLIVDFLLFMPGVYGSIFIMCMQLAYTTGITHFGCAFFLILAWLQVLCFVLDGIENVYLLYAICKYRNRGEFTQEKRNRFYCESPITYRLMWVLEFGKWGFALLGAVCSLAAIADAWLSGVYNQSWMYLVIILVEIVAFLVVSAVVNRVALGRSRRLAGSSQI